MLIYTVLNIEGVREGGRGGAVKWIWKQREVLLTHTHTVSVCFPDLLLLTSEMFGPFVQTLTVLLAHSSEVVGGRLSVGVLLCVCNGFAPTSFHAESFPTTRVVQAAGSDGQVRLQNRARFRLLSSSVVRAAGDRSLEERQPLEFHFCQTWVASIFASNIQRLEHLHLQHRNQ